jgi:hypothetical protein
MNKVSVRVLTPKLEQTQRKASPTLSRSQTRYLLRAALLLRGLGLGFPQAETTSLPHRPKNETWMRNGQEDDHNAHHHAVEDHELDLVVRNGAIEAFA